MKQAFHAVSEDYSRVLRRRLLPRKSLGSGAARKEVPRGPEGPSLQGGLRSAFVNWVSKLGEQYVEAQTSDINNVWPVIPKRLETLPGIWFIPDSVDFSFGLPPTVGDVKVGQFGAHEQGEDLIVAVERGKARPGIIYLLASPVSGKGQARPWTEAEMKRTGHDFVEFDGPWRELRPIAEEVGRRDQSLSSVGPRPHF